MVGGVLTWCLKAWFNPVFKKQYYVECVKCELL